MTEAGSPQHRPIAADRARRLGFDLFASKPEQ
jgi:hypothetical protein